MSGGFEKMCKWNNFHIKLESIHLVISGICKIKKNFQLGEAGKKYITASEWKGR